MNLGILGIGTTVPIAAIEQHEAARVAQGLARHALTATSRIRAIYRRSGVTKRHSVLLRSSTQSGPTSQTFYVDQQHADDRGPTTAQRMSIYETSAPDLAIQASRAALTAALLPAAAIDHLVTVSCTGFQSPGVDIALIRALRLRRDVTRSHIGFMGCHGALNGLRTAQALASLQPASTVLLCAVELCSLHYQYGGQRERIVANALFADGAAALVGTSRQEVGQADWFLEDSVSAVIAETETLMHWRVGDHGFEMLLSPRVPDILRHLLRPWLGQWLARRGLTIAEIGSWAIHPGGPRILDACADAAGLADAMLQPSRQVLAEFGNMSSPTILFILQRLLAAGARRPCVALAFGPGLTIEGALFR